MLDFSWSELCVVALVILFVFGPQDIPKLMYHFGRIMRRLQYLRYALSSQFEDFMHKAEVAARTDPATKQPAPVEAVAPPEKVPDHELDEDLMYVTHNPIPDIMPESKDIADEPADQPQPDRRAANAE